MRRVATRAEGRSVFASMKSLGAFCLNGIGLVLGRLKDKAAKVEGKIRDLEVKDFSIGLSTRRGLIYPFCTIYSMHP